MMSLLYFHFIALFISEHAFQMQQTFMFMLSFYFYYVYDIDICYYVTVIHTIPRIMLFRFHFASLYC